MVIAIVILFVILALIFGILLRLCFPLMLKAKTSQRLTKEGLEAEAVLLNVQQTGLYVNNQPQVKIQVQVQPRTGRNFVTETHEVVSLVDLMRLHIGGTLMVKYNPANTKEVMLLRQ